MNKNFIIKVVLIVLWLGLIFFFSNQKSSDSLDLSKSVLYKIVEVVHNKELSNSEKETLYKKYLFFIRKCAHFILYFVLAILVFILLKEYISDYRLIIYSILFAFIYSVTDEFHQAFVDGRSAMVADVFLDTFSSGISVILCYIINNRKKMEK